jgi:hypothetical protein
MPAAEPAVWAAKPGHFGRDGDPGHHMAGRRTTPRPYAEIRPDPAFQALLTPFTADERARLTESILSEGCREPLAVWAQTGRLLDGYARHAICIEHKIQFEVRLVELPDRDAAIRWRLSAQLERRNLSPFQASWVRGQLYQSLKRKPGRPRKGEKSGQSAPVSTDDDLAARWKVDARTVRRDAAFAAAMGVIQERMGVPFRDAILTREYPLTRKQVVGWARDLRTRKVGEGDIRRRVAEILEERRAAAERKKAGTEPEANEDGGDDEGSGEPTTDDEPPTDTPLRRLYQAWDKLSQAWSAASDEDKVTFRLVPSVPELAAEMIDGWASAGRVRK